MTPHGPFPIVCRGHSGGRVLAEAYIAAGIHMGVVAPHRKDTAWFAATRNPHLRAIVANAYRYPTLAPVEARALQDELRSTVDEFRRAEVPAGGPFGWKMGTNIFALPVILDALPAARVVHLIRDGLDVMLSRLDPRFEFQDPLNRLMVFGNEKVQSFRGRPLDLAVHEFRNEFEMMLWVTAVEYGLRSRASDRYLEVRYEDLCAKPVDQLRRVFNFLNAPLPPQVEHWAEETITPARVGKWRTLDPATLAGPLEIGGPLLARLGYL